MKLRDLVVTTLVAAGTATLATKALLANNDELNSKLKTDGKRVVDDLKEFGKSFSNVAKNAVDNVSAKVTEVADNVTKEVNSVLDEANEQIKEQQEQLVKDTEKVADTVKDEANSVTLDKETGTEE